MTPTPQFPELDKGYGTPESEDEEGHRRGKQGLYKQFLASAAPPVTRGCSDASLQWLQHLKTQAEDQVLRADSILEQPQSPPQQQASAAAGEPQLHDSPPRSSVEGARQEASGGGGEGASPGAGGSGGGGGGEGFAPDEAQSPSDMRPAIDRHVHFSAEPEVSSY